MIKKCTNSDCRKNFSTVKFNGICPHCGKIYKSYCIGKTSKNKTYSSQRIATKGDGKASLSKYSVAAYCRTMSTPFLILDNKYIEFPKDEFYTLFVHQLNMQKGNAMFYLSKQIRQVCNCSIGKSVSVYRCIRSQYESGTVCVEYESLSDTTFSPVLSGRKVCTSNWHPSYDAKMPTPFFVVDGKTMMFSPRIVEDIKFRVRLGEKSLVVESLLSYLTKRTKCKVDASVVDAMVASIFELSNVPVEFVTVSKRKIALRSNGKTIPGLFFWPESC